MRAAFIEHTGPADVIQVGDLPRPEAGPGQVLVRVRVVALNPINTYIRSGLVTMPMTFPYVIGSDFAGKVEAVGAGVKRFKVGDRVWGSNQGLLGRPGVAAEYAAVDEEFAYPTPDGQTDAEAAALALVGITAHLGLFRSARLTAGETVYVPGGSGGVGSCVIQMAKAAGARVATSAGSPERAELCRKLGADLALNYKADDIPARLREFAPEGIDVWFETQREPHLEINIPLLRRRGRMLLIAGRTAKPILPLGSFYPRDCSLLGFAMFNALADEQAQAAKEMRRWVEAGKLKPLIGQTFTLTDAAQAELFLEENTASGAGTLSGKVLIQID
ncbi:NADPH:quinone reductase [Tundrisphaera sp. TA3]|uniref:NADPH:quinone reductase n=1 Tax=Tundrisphaera sp. TA3 TaxID=3435775 RepID=UPI003EB70154